MELTVLRDEESQEVTTRAAQCSTDGAYKLGAWIRDSMAGIGTLTFVDPETGLFGTLGHGINDVDTAVLMKLQSGAITPASVAGVVKVNGRPGNSGGPSPPARTWAPYTPTRRAACSGHLQDPGTFTGTPVPVATAEEVHTGQATILANVAGTEVEEYTVEILKVYSNTSDTWDLMLRVTDPRLLRRPAASSRGCPARPSSRTASWWGPSPTCSSTMRTGAMAFWPRTCWTRPPRPKTPDPTPAAESSAAGVTSLTCPPVSWYIKTEKRNFGGVP